MSVEFAAPGGSTQALIDALMQRLRDCLKDLKLATDVEGEEPRAPMVVDAFLPPKRSKGHQQGEFPFVIVRATGGADEAQDDAAVRLRLVVGVFSESEQGYRDWMAVKERIRVDLLSKPVLDGRFRFMHPLVWDLQEEQPVPQWVGVIEVAYTVPGIVDNSWGEVATS